MAYCFAFLHYKQADCIAIRSAPMKRQSSQYTLLPTHDLIELSARYPIDTQIHSMLHTIQVHKFASHKAMRLNNNDTSFAITVHIMKAS